MPGNRKSIRLKNYDYAYCGAYFVTLCVNAARRGASRGALSFGHIENTKMILNDIGQIVHNSWLWMANQYGYVNLDEFIVMPNHLHGIIFLGDTDNHIVQGGSRTAPTNYGLRKPLGQLIGAFKTISTKRINQMNKTTCVRLWQRNFYDHVIRDATDLARVREYVINNPAKWEEDEYYP